MLIVFSRNSEPERGDLLETALAFDKPAIYDIDDNFFQPPVYYPRERRYLTDERMQQLERYLATASVVRVYSEPMRERAAQRIRLT